MFNLIQRMRILPTWLTALLLGGMVVDGRTARADDIGVADPILPLPLYHPRADKGGLFLATSFAMYRQTNPISVQGVGYRGFVDVTGTAQNRYFVNPTTGTIISGPSDPFVGSFVGSGTEAMNTNSVSGP
ncbi:MAG: hypothetical protein EBS30_18105, partial [Planctomycetes bacterium]|nr:hypothetical protein [Planctomycetota bacterium]